MVILLQTLSCIDFEQSSIRNAFKVKPTPKGFVKTKTSPLFVPLFFFTSIGFTKPVTLNPYLMESSRIECPPTKAHLASTNLLFPPSMILPKIFKSSFSGKHTIFKAVLGVPFIA